jgi:hypothetical protein
MFPTLAVAGSSQRQTLQLELSIRNAGNFAIVMLVV